MILVNSNKYKDKLIDIVLLFIEESNEKLNYKIDIKKIEDSLSDINHIFYIKDNEVVGVLLFYFTSPWYSSETIAQEILLFVRKEHRGGLIAHRLIKEYIKQAKENNCVRCYIDYGVRNMNPLDMERLYNFHGFSLDCSSYVKDI